MMAVIKILTSRSFDPFSSKKSLFPFFDAFSKDQFLFSVNGQSWKSTMAF